MTLFVSKNKLSEIPSSGMQKSRKAEAIFFEFASLISIQMSKSPVARGYP
jgi:hypothetical protein